MRILKQIEIEEIIYRGKSIPDYKITAILNELEKEHPGIYRVIYGEPSDTIAIINKDMANLYLELSFEVVWVFMEAFGKLPKVKNEEKWVVKNLSLIDSEMKSLTKEVPMDDKFRDTLRERFVKRSFESKIQLELLEYLETEITKYASFKSKRKPAIHLTNNLLFVLVRLMGDLHKMKASKSA